MTQPSIIERYERAVKLWEFISPNLPVPPRERLVLWLSKSTDEQIEQGFLAVPHRFRNRLPFAPEEAYAIVRQKLIDLNHYKERTEKKAAQIKSSVRNSPIPMANFTPPRCPLCGDIVEWILDGKGPIRYHESTTNLDRAIPYDDKKPDSFYWVLKPREGGENITFENSKMVAVAPHGCKHPDKWAVTVGDFRIVDGKIQIEGK